MNWLIYHNDGTHGTSPWAVVPADRLIEECEACRQHHAKCYGGWQNDNVKALPLDDDGRVMYTGDKYVHHHTEQF